MVNSDPILVAVYEVVVVEEDDDGGDDAVPSVDDCDALLLDDGDGGAEKGLWHDADSVEESDGRLRIAASDR